MFIIHKVMLVSIDNYIHGLVEGYCVANQLILEIFLKERVFHSKDINKDFHVIIIDARKPDSRLTKSNLSELQQISAGYHIPVCVIGDPETNCLKLTDSSIDCFFKEPILEQLDNYFRIHFKFNSHPFPDRRDRERRARERRDLLERNSFFNLETPDLSHSNDNISATPTKARHCYNLGPFKIDMNCNSVLFMGKDLGLTYKEFKLFSFLATDVDRVFRSDEIIEHLWSETYRANKSDLYQYMHLLRKKIEKDPERPQWILTIKRVGYRLSLTPALNR